MSDKTNTGTGGKPSAREQREQRLAEALRANLRKRKAQTRERRNIDAPKADVKADTAADSPKDGQER